MFTTDVCAQYIYIYSFVVYTYRKWYLPFNQCVLLQYAFFPKSEAFVESLSPLPLHSKVDCYVMCTTNQY